MPLAQILLLSTMAFGSDRPASCKLASNSIVSLSPSGLTQVSNLTGIDITCRVPARPFPSKRGESRNALRVATTAYNIFPDGSKQLVPSEARESGGGFGHGREYVRFSVVIPLKPAGCDAEARRLLAKVEKDVKSRAPEQMTEEAHQRALERLRDVVHHYQERVGHFQVECRIMDGDRVMGVGVVELEVLFKGHYSDVLLPAAPPAQ